MEGAMHYNLLLLPPPPVPSSFAALKAAYGASLFAVLRGLARSPDYTNGTCLLEIALPCPHLHGQQHTPRSALYPETQRLLSGLYKLISVISAKHSIDLDSDGIDARVLLVAHPRGGSAVQLEDGSPEADTQGPVISMWTLARSNRPWKTIYAVETEAGGRVLTAFVNASKGQHWNVVKVRGGLVQVDPSAKTIKAGPETDTVRHYAVAVGGTFDHLHIGHKLLLTMTAFAIEGAVAAEEKKRTITVGITGDELLKNKKYAEFLESWDTRQRAASALMRSLLYFGPAEDKLIKTFETKEPGPNGHVVQEAYPCDLVVKYVEIWDPFGPTITDESISALVISGETRAGGKAVNDKRAEKGWRSLEVLEVNVLDSREIDEDNQSQAQIDENFQSKLSSTQIRRIMYERSRIGRDV